MNIVRHYEFPETHDDGLDADEALLFTSPGDLDDTKRSTGGAGILLLYAVGVVSLIAAGVLATG